LFNLLFYTEFFDGGLSQPHPGGSRGWGMSRHKNMLLERQAAPSWWGCLFAVCFARKKPSGWEFSVPARMDLADKLSNRSSKIFLLRENVYAFFEMISATMLAVCAGKVSSLWSCGLTLKRWTPHYWAMCTR
jgi:hypothetical protein